MLLTDREKSAPLRHYLAAMAQLAAVAATDEAHMLGEGERLLQELVATSDWLPSSVAGADSRGYAQYLLYCDPQERFSVVSFVWGPGQRTPIHDHTVWGLVGVLRGAELERGYRLSGTALTPGEERKLLPGMVSRLSPRDGDIHEVANAFDDRASVSIHVYGANIGKVARSTFNRTTGARESFVSGYSNDTLPNIWM